MKKKYKKKLKKSKEIKQITKKLNQKNTNKNKSITIKVKDYNNKNRKGKYIYLYEKGNKPRLLKYNENITFDEYKTIYENKINVKKYKSIKSINKIKNTLRKKLETTKLSKKSSIRDYFIKNKIMEKQVDMGDIIDSNKRKEILKKLIIKGVKKQYKNNKDLNNIIKQLWKIKDRLSYKIGVYGIPDGKAEIMELAIINDIGKKDLNELINKYKNAGILPNQYLDSNAKNWIPNELDIGKNAIKINNYGTIKRIIVKIKLVG